MMKKNDNSWFTVSLERLTDITILTIQLDVVRTQQMLATITTLYYYYCC